MSTVVIYGFEGTYSGSAEYEYRQPQAGATHKCMLFLSQLDDAADFSVALHECTKYGFETVTFSGHGPLQVEVLNSDLYRGFAGLYEEALRQGHALVYYPNA